MDELAQDGSRGQRNAWQAMSKRVATLETELAEAQADLSGYVATSLVAGVLGGLVYALATAGPLVWMLRLPRRVSVD